MKRRKIRFLKPDDKKQLMLKVAQTDWLNLVSSVPSLDEAIELFHSSLGSLMPSLETEKTIKFTNADLPWINSNYKSLVNMKMRFYSRGNQIMFEHYRDKCTKVLTTLKQKYVDDALATNNSRKLWDGINKLNGRRKESGYNTTLWNSELDQCQELNSFFRVSSSRKAPASNWTRQSYPDVDWNFPSVK